MVLNGPRLAGVLLMFANTAMWCLPALNAQQPVQRKAKVMVLGTYHFDNPNRDYVKTNVDNHLSEKRQKEIAEVAELLAGFKPTKIALEAVDGVSKVQQHFLDYIRGDYKLTADERDQIGLRLAKQLGLKRVYAIDYQQDMDLDTVVAAAQKSKNESFLELFQKTIGVYQSLQARMPSLTVRQALGIYNGPEEIVRGRKLYLAMAGVSSEPGKFEGADALAGWYQRNFRIYTNLVRVVDSPDDRVLVIYGAGHLGTLCEIIEASPNLELVSAFDYLKE